MTGFDKLPRSVMRRNAIAAVRRFARWRQWRRRLNPAILEEIAAELVALATATRFLNGESFALLKDKRAQALLATDIEDEVRKQTRPRRFR